MTDQYETAADAAATLDAWSAQPTVLVEPYYYYQNHVPTHIVELRTIKCRQGWEYDISVRRIDARTMNRGAIERQENETELAGIRVALEDVANTVVITAMEYLDAHSAFDEDAFENTWKDAVEA